MPRMVTIHLTSPLPIEIDGDRTRWRIDLVFGGKNDKHGMFIAHCLSSGNSITILEGRARYMEGTVMRPLSAPAGSLLAQIYSKLVRLGLAEYVTR